MAAVTLAQTELMTYNQLSLHDGTVIHLPRHFQILLMSDDMEKKPWLTAGSIPQEFLFFYFSAEEHSLPPYFPEGLSASDNWLPQPDQPWVAIELDSPSGTAQQLTLFRHKERIFGMQHPRGFNPRETLETIVKRFHQPQALTSLVTLDYLGTLLLFIAFLIFLFQLLNRYYALKSKEIRTSEAHD
jgi:hypothetical protein